MRPAAAAFAALLAALVVAGLGGCAARSAADEKPEPARFVVAPGQQFDVRLPANPSTGYQWKIGTPLDEAVVALVGSDFERSETPPPAAAGTAAAHGADAVPPGAEPVPAGADVVPPEPVSPAARAAARAGAPAASAASEGEPASSRVGQGGIEAWRFEAVAPGRTQIELVYVRPWETDVAPVRWAIYSVEVR